MTSNQQPDANIEAFDEFWRHAVRRVVDESVAHYGERLVSIYARGSVGRGEAVSDNPEFSDLDTLYFTTDGYNAADKQWRNEINDRLHAEIPGPSWHWIPPARSEDVLLRPEMQQIDADVEARIDAALRGMLEGVKPGEDIQPISLARAAVYNLQSDATLVYGRDLLETLVAPPRSKLWARVGFQTPWDVVRHAAGLESAHETAFTKEYIHQFPLPSEAPQRLRKLARIAVWSGADLLMGQGRLVSYKGADVLPVLKSDYPQWTSFLDETERLYIKPTAATADDVAGYLNRLVPWVDWIGGELAVE